RFDQLAEDALHLLPEDQTQGFLAQGPEHGERLLDSLAAGVAPEALEHVREEVLGQVARGPRGVLADDRGAAGGGLEIDAGLLEPDRHLEQARAADEERFSLSLDELQAQELAEHARAAPADELVERLLREAP